MKLWGIKHCVLAAAGVDIKYTIFTIKDIKSYVPVVIFSAKDNQNFLAKDLKVQFIWMNMKQKVRIKMQQTSKDIFSNQIL